MRRNLRPLWLHNLSHAYLGWWQKHFLEPQFDAVGPGLSAIWPWCVSVFGRDIRLGSYVHLRTTPELPIRLSIWKDDNHDGKINIGNYVLISPGCRLTSAHEITIGDSAMLAAQVVLSDSDWHDLYDRTLPPGAGAPISIGANAWIGERAIVCKGVTIGENSIIGAGSIVTRDVPANVIAAGNPVQVIRELDPERTLCTRADMFDDPQSLIDQDRYIYHTTLKNNTILGWLRAKLAPTRED